MRYRWIVVRNVVYVGNGTRASTTRVEKVRNSRSTYEFCSGWKFSHSSVPRLSLHIENWLHLILFFPLSLFPCFHLESETRPRTSMYRIRGKIESCIFSYLTKRRRSAGDQVTLVHQPILSTGVQIPRRRRSIFINGSALTSPGTCVTVNAHSTEHCGTLSLSMTDITHSRTSRWLLRIPYSNAARPISRTVHLWNWHRTKRPVLYYFS